MATIASLTELLQAMEFLILYIPRILKWSCRQPLNHFLDPIGALLKIRINLFQRPRWRKHIEMPIKRNLKADNTHLAILLIRLGLVDPSIRYVVYHLPLEVVLYRLTQGHVLVIP